MLACMAGTAGIETVGRRAGIGAEMEDDWSWRWDRRRDSSH